MKPKVFCAECNTELQWGDQFCAGCGNKVEWPLGNVPASQVSSQASAQAIRCSKCGTNNSPANAFCETCGSSLSQGKEKSSRQSSRPQLQRESRKSPSAPVTNSWKLVAGFFAFLLVGITLMQMLSGTNPIPSKPPQTAEQPAANVQVVPQIEEMEKQVAADPDNHELIVRLANFLHDNRFYDRAIKYYTDYLVKHPNDANARVDMGICYNDLGNLDEAKKQIQLALKHEPKHLFAHFNLGIVHLRGGDVEKANEWFKKVVALDPKSEVAQRAQQLLTQHNPQNLQPN